MLPGYHLGSIQGLGFSDNTDSLFWIVEVVQVDADHAVPLFCVLISHNSFFVSIRDTYFRQTFLTLSHLGKKMSINVWDTFLLMVVAYFSWTSSFFIRKNTRNHFIKIRSFQRFDKLTVKYQFYCFLIWTIYIYNFLHFIVFVRVERL